MPREYCNSGFRVFFKPTIFSNSVSSWENEKSIPELQLIIAICNTYNLSLDSLLNEDHKYVNKIDMAQKMVRILKRTLPIFCILACVYIAILGVWKINAAKENEKFVSSVANLGFTLENGIYVMHDGDTVYKLPNQKLPFMKFKFNLQHITAAYRNEKFSCNILLSCDDQQYSFNIDYGIDKCVTGSITKNGTIEYKNLSKDGSAMINENKSTIENILKKMVTYYNTAYNL